VVSDPSAAVFELDRRRLLKMAGATAGLCALRSAVPGWGARSAAAASSPTLDDLTGGRISVGATITRDNADVVKELLSPGTYEKIVR